jgi:2-hydroxy-6-oxonona-2,4-dienedioate hydrolase
MALRAPFVDLSTEVDWQGRAFRIESLYSRDGHGRDSPIVLIPGLGASSRMILPTARLLPPGRDVFVVELPGQGGSAKPDRALDLPAYAAIVAAWGKARGIERAVWLGHSFGAQVLLELAVDRPELIDRLVLVSLTVDPEARTLSGQLGRLILDASREPPRLLYVLARDYLQTGPRELVHFAGVALGDRVEEKLPAVEAPTLLVGGERDPLVPAGWTRRMEELAPRAQVVIIPGAAHAVPYSAPGDLALAVDEFLAALPPVSEVDRG